MSPIRVLIVDDHPMVIEGLKVLLQTVPDVAVVGSAGSGAAALAFVDEQAPDVVLLDINLPDGSGIDFCAQLLRKQPGLKVLGLSTFNERAYIARLLQLGASGYVLKNTHLDELADAIRRVHQGRKYFSEEAQNTLLEAAVAPAPTGPVLTRREKEILALLAEGCTNQVIAERLFLSPLTVDTHRRNLLAKFAVSNTASLIHQATKHQFI